MATAQSSSYAWVWVVIIVVISAAVYMYVRRDDSDQMIENLADRTRPAEEVVVTLPSAAPAAGAQREQDLASRVLSALREQQASRSQAEPPASPVADPVPTIRLTDPPAPPPPAALTSRQASGADDHVPTLSLTPSPIAERPSSLAPSRPIPSDPAPTLSALPPPMVDPVRPAPVVTSVAPRPTAPVTPSPPVAPRPVASTPASSGTATRTPAPAPARPARGGSYTIKPGDNYSLIAEEVYGDQKHWLAIQDANPGVDPNRLQIGQVIRLPDLDARSVSRDQEVAAARSGSGPRVITVESGDVLSTIAQKVYGKAAMWRVIYEANRDQLVSPDDLQPGMKLKIPPASSAGTTSQR